jgi:hypothetical protein
MRTQDEIVKRFNERKSDDMFGFEIGEYLNALSHETALANGLTKMTKDEWGESRLLSESGVREQMREYVDFAYEKINNERGISANRTVMHYIAWLWLVGEDELLAWVEREYETNYHGYGRHIVDEIVKRLDLRGGKS